MGITLNGAPPIELTVLPESLRCGVVFGSGSVIAVKRFPENGKWGEGSHIQRDIDGPLPRVDSNAGMGPLVTIWGGRPDFWKLRHALWLLLAITSLILMAITNILKYS